MNTIPELFRTNAARTGDRICLKLPGKDPGLTCAELHALLLNKSRLFSEQCALPQGATIAIVADNSLEYLVAAYAAMFAGHPVFVISTRSLPEHLVYFMQRAQVAQVFFSDSCQALCRAALQSAGLADSVKALPLDIFRPAPADLLMPVDRPTPAAVQDSPAADDTAVILHTSGTTRTPKLVYLTHRNILANQRASGHAFREHWTADVVTLGWLPLYHGYALLAEFLRDMLSGATLVLYAAKGQINAELLLDAIRRNGVTALCCVPWMLGLLHERCRAEGDAGETLRLLRSLRFIVTGGASLGSLLGDFFRERDVRIVTMFGLSEAAGFVLHSPFDGSAWDELESNAQGIDFVPVAPDAREHELVITDTELFSGKVLFPPDETGPQQGRTQLHTGDLFLRKGRGWAYLGRGDQIYNGAHGEKVNPLLFERALESVTGVDTVFVHGAELAFNVALVKLKPGLAADRDFIESMKRHVQDTLNPSLENADRVYPGDLFVLDDETQLPLTPKGSVNRKEAAQLVLKLIDARANPLGQGVADALAVSAVFHSELATYLRDVDTADMADATLLELGFDSLMTLSLRNNLQDKLQLQIPVELMLAYPPLGEFESALQRLNEEARSSSPQQLVETDVEQGGWRPIALEQVTFHLAYHLFPGPTFGGSFSLVAPRHLAAAEVVGGLRFLERNHEVLRSIYRADGYFRIADDSLVERAFIGHYLMQGSHDLNDNLPVQALIQDELALQPYNFEEGAAWRYATVDIADAAGEVRTMVYIGINHIIGDFRSFSLLVREFMCYLDGGLTPTDVVPDLYRRSLKSAAPAQIERLQAAMQTLLTAGLDTLPRGVDLRRGARLRFNFSDINMATLSSVFSAHNISVFSGVYAAWVVAASRHIEGLALTDFPGLTSVTTRIDKALETLMGCFVFTPLYRFSLKADDTLRAAALKVQQTALEAFKDVLVDPVGAFERAVANPRNLMPIIKRNIVLYRSPDELVDPVPGWGCYRNDYFEDRCNVGAYFDFCANRHDNSMEGYLTVNLLFCSPDVARKVLNEVELLLQQALRQPALDFQPLEVLENHAGSRTAAVSQSGSSCMPQYKLE